MNRIIELEGAFNVRDLGGLRTNTGTITTSGLLYRGDSLDRITESDRTILSSRLRISRVIDLRTFEEVGHLPIDHRIISRSHIPLIAEGRIGREPFPSDNPKELARVYLENVTNGAAAVREIVDLISDATGRHEPCIFHCAAGRDRTGVISGIILDFLDVERSQIADDYVQSNHHAKEVTLELKRSPLYSNSPRKSEHLLLLHAETILQFLTLLDLEFGSSAGYLRAVGVQDSTLAALRASMLSSEPVVPLVPASESSGQSSLIPPSSQADLSTPIEIPYHEMPLILVEDACQIRELFERAAATNISVCMSRSEAEMLIEDRGATDVSVFLKDFNNIAAFFALCRLLVEGRYERLFVHPGINTSTLLQFADDDGERERVMELISSGRIQNVPSDG